MLWNFFCVVSSNDTAPWTVEMGADLRLARALAGDNSLAIHMQTFGNIYPDDVHHDFMNQYLDVMDVLAKLDAPQSTPNGEIEGVLEQRSAAVFAKVLETSSLGAVTGALHAVGQLNPTREARSPTRRQARRPATHGSAVGVTDAAQSGGAARGGRFDHDRRRLLDGPTRCYESTPLALRSLRTRNWRRRILRGSRTQERPPWA